MQTVQKTLPQYDLRSRSSRQNPEDMEENMATAQTLGSQIDAAAELASIKTLLQGNAAEI